MTDARRQPRLHIILHTPEIPPNTGNVIRLCANIGADLHLVRPLGFSLDDKRLRRAGLDYHEYASLQVHDDWAACRAALAGARLFACTTRATQPHTAVQFQAGDAVVFGAETRGLPAELLQSLPESHILRIPMRPNNRSLNLSNAVAVVAYEAWRQLGFCGAS